MRAGYDVASFSKDKISKFVGINSFFVGSLNFPFSSAFCHFWMNNKIHTHKSNYEQNLRVKTTVFGMMLYSVLVYNNKHVVHSVI